MPLPDQQEIQLAAESAKQWLEQRAAKARVLTAAQICDCGIADGFFHSVTLSSLSVSLCSRGRVLCSFNIPPHLTDEQGNWHAGAIAALIDDVGAAAIMTVVGHIKISVDFSISYFSPAAKVNEEVEIDARLIEQGENGEGKLSAVLVEVRKKEGGRMVALGRQWMASTRPDKHRRSNL